MAAIVDAARRASGLEGSEDGIRDACIEAPEGVTPGLRARGTLDVVGDADERELNAVASEAGIALRVRRERRAHRTGIPNFEPFLQWSKLRLSIALQQGDASRAAAEVRHLADLCASTQLSIGVQVGVALRTLEATTREAAVVRGHEVSSWPETSEAHRAAYRSLRPAHLYFFPGVSTRVMKRAASCLGPQRCILLVEGLAAHRELGDLASNHTTAVLESLIGENKCRGGSLDLAKKAQRFTAQQVQQTWDEDLLPGLRPERSVHPLERFLDAGAP